MKPMTGSAASALTIRPTTTFGICAGAGLEVKLELPADLKAGSYRFGALERIRGKDGIVEVWPARDSLVLKAMSLVLTAGVKPCLSKNCHHLKGHGGRGGVEAAVHRSGQLFHNCLAYKRENLLHP